MADLPVPFQGPDVGECIYCGATSTELGREHAVPYGLNGPWILLRASCTRCAGITHRFERDTLRGLHATIRAALAMQSRRPNRWQGMMPVVLESGGVQRTVHVRSEEYPLYLPAPLFPPPGCLTAAAPSSHMTTELRFLHVAGPTFGEVAHQHGADFAGAHLSFAPSEFARTLAKVAFAAAIYVLGLAPFANTPIRRVILGEDRCVGQWVGSWTGAAINEAKGLHSMKVLASGTDIHVVLRLFSQFGAPEYLVVLGPAAQEFVASSAWPWK